MYMYTYIYIYKYKYICSYIYILIYYTEHTLHLSISDSSYTVLYLDPIYTGIFKMIIGVLTTCHTQHT